MNKTIKKADQAIKNLQSQKEIMQQMLYHMEAMERIISDFNAWARVEFPEDDHEDVKWDKYLIGEDYQ